jgi:MoaA/NifB/PqqE/SkfB family radical SAM enzyme
MQSIAPQNPVREATTGEPGFFNKLIRRKKLESVFLFITSQCQSKCRTCFNHENLNRKDDLSSERIKTISQTAGTFDKLWLSGGEPYLRKDMVDIIAMFHENNAVKTINLPSNGLAKEKIVRMTGELLDRCPSLTVHLNFSLDGLGKTHDSIRGVPGNFLTTVDTIETVRELYGDRKNLLVNIATVITSEAYDQMVELAAYVDQKNLCDLHIHEILRGDPPDPSLQAITLDQVKELNRNLAPVMDLGAKRLFKDLKRGKKIARLTYIGIMSFMEMIKEQNHEGPHPWGMKCTAGDTTFVIDANGDFRSCEMRPPIGNLKDYNYNLKAAYDSPVMKNEVYEIGGGKRANCWCTHGCWITSSLKFSPYSILVRLPSVYRKKEKMIRATPPLPVVDVEAIEAAAGKKPSGGEKSA